MRALHIWSVRDAQRTLDREEQRLGVRRGSAGLSRDMAADLEAAWERTELAAAEVANDHPLINATTLIIIHGALDALFEELAPSSNKMAVDLHATAIIMDRTRRAHSDLAASVAPDVLEAVRTALRDVPADDLPNIPRLEGRGAKRWEKVLHRAKLDAPPGHAIPAELDQPCRN